MLKSRFPQLTVEMNARVEAAMVEGRKAVVEAAQARVPVNTGRLRDAIHAEDDKVVAGNREAFYGHLVEYGTSGIPARPFLTPALEETKPRIVTLVSAALRRL